MPNRNVALVVEDSPEFARAAALMLRRLGFRSVAIGHDGREAWGILVARPFDLVLSDWNMEPIDGHTLLTWLRCTPRYASLPFILMSAIADENRQRAAIAAGASAFLAKNKNPTDAQINEALAGNLCRCGTHQRIVAAVKRYLAAA